MECGDEQPLQVIPHEISSLNGVGKPADCLDVCDSCSDNNSDEHNKSDIPTLLKLIEEVHSQKLNTIHHDQNLNDKEKAEEKLLALQSYIQQLQEQNNTFASTMIELEKEARQRVTQMEKRLKSSAKTTMEAVINMHDCEKEMRRIVEERLYIELLYKNVQQHLSSIKVENGFLRDQNFNLNHDVQALLHIIHHARSTGHWEMDCVTFCEVTPEQVFGPVQSLSKIYPAESDTEDTCKETKKKKHFSSASLSSSPLVKSFSVPDIGNIYSCMRNTRRSNSCEITSNNRNLSFPASAKYSNKKNRDTPELLKDLTIENLEKRLCIRKGQSEPHLFMFNDNIYKYRPCESNEKHSCDTLNENYESNHPPYQSIDLKFPTEDSTLKLCPWNKFKNKSYLETQRSSFIKETPNSSYSSSETDIRRSIKLMHLYKIFKEHSNSSSKENQNKHSVGLQTEIKKINQSTQVNSNFTYESDTKENSLVEVLKENLIKAKTKAEEKSILIEQLQSHLTSAVKEVELKDKVLSNLENKLQNSRDECSNLKNQVVDLNNEVQLIMKDVEDNHSLNASLKLQMEQQSHIIRTLQEALVQSKRAFDAVHPKMPSISTADSENKFSRSQQTSRSSIIDI